MRLSDATILMTSVLVVFGAWANCPFDDGIVRKGDILVRWPKDSKGTAKVPEDIRHIGEDAFFDCKEIAEVIFPHGIETIGAYAFGRCYGMTDVKLPGSVTNVGSHAFFLCRGLTNAIIGTGIRSLSSGMFKRCLRLECVDLPESLQEIGTGAFCECRSLKSITIPDGVTNIDESAFAYCSRLRKVVLPDNLRTNVGEVFGWCYDLEWEKPSLDDEPLSPASLGEAGKDVDTDSDDGMAGLGEIVRLAADGFSQASDDCRVDLFALDCFAANIKDFHIGMTVDEVRDVIRRHGYGFGHASMEDASGNMVDTSTCVRFGYCPNGSVSLFIWYDDGKVCRVSLSEAFKYGVALGIKLHGEEYMGRDVLRWLDDYE